MQFGYVIPCVSKQNEYIPSKLREIEIEIDNLDKIYFKWKYIHFYKNIIIKRINKILEVLKTKWKLWRLTMEMWKLVKRQQRQ